MSGRAGVGVDGVGVEGVGRTGVGVDGVAAVLCAPATTEAILPAVDCTALAIELDAAGGVYGAGDALGTGFEVASKFIDVSND